MQEENTNYTPPVYPTGKSKKAIPTFIGIAIIVIVAILLFGGVFAWQYFVIQNNPTQNNQLKFQTSGDITSPVLLGVGETGKWTVNKIGENIIYGVDWESAGFNVDNYQKGIVPNSQNSNVFTHSYSKKGIYTIQFFAKDIKTNTMIPLVDSSVEIRVGVPGAPTISSINPSHGAVGTVVTIIGSNFTRYGNLVSLGKQELMGASATVNNLESIDGQTLKFTVPATVFKPTDSPSSNSSEIPAELGKYDVAVNNTNGGSYAKNNSISFTIDSPDQTAGRKTYTNNEFGYQIEYPNNWVVDANAASLNKNDQGDALFCPPELQDPNSINGFTGLNGGCSVGKTNGGSINPEAPIVLYQYSSAQDHNCSHADLGSDKEGKYCYNLVLVNQDQKYSSIYGQMLSTFKFTTPAAQILYVDKVNGYQLKLPSDWTGYKVIDGKFLLPTSDKTWYETINGNDTYGYASVFAILKYSIDDWNKMKESCGLPNGQNWGPGCFTDDGALGKNNTSFFVAVWPNAGPDVGGDAQYGKLREEVTGPNYLKNNFSIISK